MNLRNVVIGAVGGMFLLVVLWFLFIFRPTGDDIADVRDQIDVAEAEEQTLRATLARLESIDENRPELEAELRRLRAAVPPQPELASFILAAHEAAAKADLSFMSITPALPAAGPIDGVAVIGAGMELEGSFFAVLDYLDRLEDLERIVVVDSIDLTGALQEEEEEEAGASGGSAGVPATTGTTAPAAGDVVSFPTAGGEVVTDRGTLGLAAATSTTTPGQVAAALVERPAVITPDAFTLTVTLQTRLFTTAEVTGPAGATTTTTAPAGATTTTTGGG